MDLNPLKAISGLFSLRRRQTVPSKVESTRPLTFRRGVSGVIVTEDNALNFSAVFSAVRNIAEPLASVPWNVHKSGATTNFTTIAQDHPVQRLLHLQPNRETDTMVFRETIIGHALLWGNGYAEIERDGAGRPVALWLIEPHRVNVMRNDAGEVVYRVWNNVGEATILPARDVFHLKGLGYDGLKGYSVVSLARDTIGLGIAAERYGGAFFGNGSRPGGVLEHPSKLNKETQDNLRSSWEEIHKGPDSGNRVAVLENGMKFHQTTIPPEDAQFLGTREFQVVEVSRWFKVPPHKLGEMGRATFKNIEEQNIQFVSDTLVAWAFRMECEANAKLFANRGQHINKLNLNGLMRGNLEGRYKSYAIARQWGWMSANDVRRLEDMDPLPADQGDIYLSPSNMMPAEKALEDPQPPPAAPGVTSAVPPAGDDDPAGGDPDDQRSRAAHAPLFIEAAQRCLTMQCQRIQQAYRAKPEVDRSMKRLGDHSVYMYRQFRGLVNAVCDTLGPVSTGSIPLIDAEVRAIADHLFDQVGVELQQAHDTDSVDELIGLWKSDGVKQVSNRFLTYAVDTALRYKAIGAKL